MKEIEIDKLKILLEKTEKIKKEIDKNSFESGENYNIFNVLRIRKNEVLHSRFIKDLLNPKGSHKQGAFFLEKFLNVLQSKFNIKEEKQNEHLEKLKTYKPQDFTTFKDEYNLGEINKTLETGGFIDIYIEGPNNCIIIENKIDAYDQKKQLIRYRNYNRNAFLIYLTKFGKNPDAISTKSDIENSLTENEDYFCISYQIDIINWLQKCIESDELKEKTNIISILKQYLKMIKQITNQNSVEENIQLAEVLRANIDSIENVKKLNYALTSNEFYKPLIDKLIYISKSNNGIIEDENNLRKYKASKSGILIKFYKDKFKKFYFTFKFDCNEGYTNFSFSIRTKDSSSNTETKIGISNKYIKDHPNAIENKNEAYNFLFSEELEGYTDWENGNTIKNILDGKFEERYRMKIDELEKFIIEFEQGNEK